MQKDEKPSLYRTKSNFAEKCQNERMEQHSMDILTKGLRELEQRVSQLEQWLEDQLEDITEEWDSTDDFEEDKISETE